MSSGTSPPKESRRNGKKGWQCQGTHGEGARRVSFQWITSGAEWRLQSVAQDGRSHADEAT